MPFTLGFRTAAELTTKFTGHRAEFGVKTESEYLARADAFLGGPRGPDTWQCVRASNGDVLRYSEGTEEFGVLRGGYIVTYFTPDPSEHGMPSNLEYFRNACRQ